MKKTSLFAAFLVFASVAPLQAAQTNLVQSLRFNLSALFQGPPVTNQNVVTYSVIPRKITTTEIIQSVGASLGSSFTAYAKLLLVRQLPEGNPRVMIQDNGQRVDVTGYFSLDKDDVRVVKGISDVTLTVERGVEYGNWSFRLRDDGSHPDLNMHFRVRGYTQTKFRTITDSYDTIVGEAEELISTVAGTADLNDREAPVRGTVAVVGRTVEVLN
jgi:hypothetical protein